MKEPTLEDVYRFVSENNLDAPFVSTNDVHDHFERKNDVTRRTIRDRLNTLHDEDRIKKEKIGQSSVWWTEKQEVQASANSARPVSESQ